MVGFAIRINLLEALHEHFVVLIIASLVLRTVKLLAPHGVTKGDASLELTAVQEWIRSVPDTRGVISVLIVIREGTPFGTGIDAPGGNDNAARFAEGIAALKVLDEVRRVFFAVVTDETNT